MQIEKMLMWQCDVQFLPMQFCYRHPGKKCIPNNLNVSVSMMFFHKYVTLKFCMILRHSGLSDSD